MVLVPHVKLVLQCFERAGPYRRDTQPASLTWFRRHQTLLRIATPSASRWPVEWSAAEPRGPSASPDFRSPVC